MNSINPDLTWIIWIPVIVGYLFACFAFTENTHA